MEVRAKGIEHSVKLSEVLGIGRPYQLLLPEAAEPLVALPEEIPINYQRLEGSQADGVMCSGAFTKVSRKEAEASLESLVPDFSNLKVQLLGPDGEALPGTLYVKVVGAVPGDASRYSVRFTSVPPEIDALLQGFAIASAAEQSLAASEEPRAQVEAS
jgi:adenylate cyclase